MSQTSNGALRHRMVLEERRLLLAHSEVAKALAAWEHPISTRAPDKALRALHDLSHAYFRARHKIATTAGSEDAKNKAKRAFGLGASAGGAYLRGLKGSGSKADEELEKAVRLFKRSREGRLAARRAMGLPG